MAITADTDDEAARERPIFSFGIQSREVVPVLAIASGLAAAVSRQQPTGNAASDLVLTFAFGAAITWLGQFTRAQALLASAVMAFLFSGLQLPAFLIAGAAAAAALFITAWRPFDRDSWAIGAAISSTFTAQAALNMPNVGFTGSASVLATLALAPIVVVGFQQLPAAKKRRITRGLVLVAAYSIIATALAVVAALTVHDRVERGIEQAEDGVTAVEQGDQPQALTLLETAQTNFEQAGDRLSGFMTWPSRIVPIAAQHSRALETAADQGVALASTAARTITQADVEKIRGQNGEIDLTVVAAVNAELNLANGAIVAAQRSLQDVNTPWLLPQLSSRLVSVNEELAATAADIDLANHATAVLPGILGANGQRRYLVMFIQPAESREFGGLIGAYGLLEIDNGRFNLAESGSINRDFVSGSASFTSPDDFPSPFVAVGPQLNPQNLTAIADLSTIGDAVQDLVPQWRENPDFTIDGVITIDPYAMAGMLELTGPLLVEGRDEPIDAENAVDFLLRDQYIEFDAAGRDTRQDVLQELAREAFDQLFAIEIPGPEKLGSIFGPVARANRLSMVTINDEENAFFNRVFLSADMPEVGSAVDMLGIFSQTATASKIDAYATRSVTYDVVVDPATGEVSGDLTIIDRNDAPPDANSFVLGRQPTGSPSGNPLSVGDNLLALGIYTRADVEALEADTPFRRPDTLPAFTYDRHAIIYEVPLGGTAQITASLSSTVGPGRYDFFVPAQATANLVSFTLNVRAAPGWRVVGADSTADGSWSQTFMLDEARGLTFLFEATD